MNECVTAHYSHRRTSVDSVPMRVPLCLHINVCVCVCVHVRYEQYEQTAVHFSFYAEL